MRFLQLPLCQLCWEVSPALPTAAPHTVPWWQPPGCSAEQRMLPQHRLCAPWLAACYEDGCPAPTHPASLPPRVPWHPREGSAPLDTDCPSNYSSGCRKRRGRPCRKRGVPLWVTEKQPAEVCRHQYGPAEQQSPGPRAIAGLRHPEQYRHHPACPRASSLAMRAPLTVFIRPGITRAPSPEPCQGTPTAGWSAAALQRGGRAGRVA